MREDTFVYIIDEFKNIVWKNSAEISKEEFIAIMLTDVAFNFLEPRNVRKVFLRVLHHGQDQGQSAGTNIMSTPTAKTATGESGGTNNQ